MNPDKRNFLLGLSDVGLVPAAVLLAGGGLSACSFGSGPHHTGRHAPGLARAADKEKHAGATALVLSSGGPRGFVHVGVLEALDEIGFHPELVVGASVGALLAALYCSGLNGKALRELALELSVTELANVALGADETFNGAPLARYVNDKIDHKSLEQLARPCAIAALEKETRTPVLFTRGDTGVAVQASAAIEGRFTPVMINQRNYMDLDSVAPLPVRLTRNLGASRVVSVDASAHENRAPPGAERYRTGDRIKRSITRPDAESADLNLHPFFGYWVSMSTEFRERAINAGYTETIARRREIERLIDNRALASTSG